jgi:hypothetical protein
MLGTFRLAKIKNSNYDINIRNFPPGKNKNVVVKSDGIPGVIFLLAHDDRHNR